MNRNRRTATAAPPPPDVIPFAVEIGGETAVYEVDPTADLGELRPAEVGLMTAYAVRHGHGPDDPRSWAAAYILAGLFRQITDAGHDLEPMALLDGMV